MTQTASLVPTSVETTSRQSSPTLYVERDTAWLLVRRRMVGTMTRLEWDEPSHRLAALKAAWTAAQAAIGMLYGGRVFMSNLLESDAAGQHDCAFIHRDILTIAVQAKPEINRDFIIEALSDAVVADQIYGVKELSRPGESAANVTLTDNYGVYLATV